MFSTMVMRGACGSLVMRPGPPTPSRPPMNTVRQNASSSPSKDVSTPYFICPSVDSSVIFSVSFCAIQPEGREKCKCAKCLSEAEREEHWAKKAHRFFCSGLGWQAEKTRSELAVTDTCGDLGRAEEVVNTQRKIARCTKVESKPSPALQLVGDIKLAPYCYKLRDASAQQSSSCSTRARARRRDVKERAVSGSAPPT